MILVFVGIFRLLLIDLIILVWLLCNSLVNVYLDKVFGMGVIVLRMVVGLVLNVMLIGKGFLGCFFI